MGEIIIYGSNYGTTQRYAEELSKRTGIRAISYEGASDIATFETIIYLGGLYAGGVKGLKDTIKLIPKSNQSKIIIITVGLADTTDEKNTEHIKSSIKAQIPIEIYDKAKIFHLRGGIDYGKLNFKHKLMMRLLYNKTKKIPQEKQTAEVKAMIETFNKKVDFVDFNKLNPIMDAI
ncbi:flavodoxin domain-containing protein [Clostridium sp. AL.422]|uniref:flavodoxin domain-containing protein n=1 Tax=Clostridium TaxID=1485 RepID=UPI00293DE438|nr:MULTISPECIES: flavodoxin domain-containing protein [unclassified Clostridium]MDV4152011.1 flavodoxin domain-containing protein [Clostridium sp. AL.422]